MSWWLHVLPLAGASDETLDWARNAFPDAYGLPTQMPTPMQTPTIGQLIAAIECAGCHGSPWFSIQGEYESPIAMCPSPQTCVRDDGLDLGEVNPKVAEGADNGRAVQRNSTIHNIGFRGPSPAAVLKTMTVLAASAGHLILFDDGVDHMFVLDPADDPSRIAAAWPWS